MGIKDSKDLDMIGEAFAKWANYFHLIILINNKKVHEAGKAEPIEMKLSYGKVSYVSNKHRKVIAELLKEKDEGILMDKIRQLRDLSPEEMRSWSPSVLANTFKDLGEFTFNPVPVRDDRCR